MDRRVNRDGKAVWREGKTYLQVHTGGPEIYLLIYAFSCGFLKL